MSDTESGSSRDGIFNQRIRNRIFEWLVTVSSTEHRANLGSDEIVNSWFDFVPNASIEEFPDPTYTDAERQAIGDVTVALENLCSATSNPMPTIQSLDSVPSWAELIKVGRAALSVFARRGRSDEEA